MPIQQTTDQASRVMKHKKSLTGCWTCRSRKIKCDEQRPACGQCQRRSFRCQGYGVRLHWLVPETGPISSETRDLVPRGVLRRGQLPIERPTSVLSHDEIEQILKSVDEFQNSDDVSSPKTLFIHSFGAFHGAFSDSEGQGLRRHRNKTEYEDHNHQNDIDEYDRHDLGFSGSSNKDHTIFDDSSTYTTERASMYLDEPILVPETLPSGSPQHIVEDLSDRSHYNDSIASLPTLDCATPAMTSDCSVYAPSSSGYGAITKTVGQNPDVQDNFTRSHRRQIGSTLRPSLEPLRLSEQEQYLMRYYIEKVVRLSCVIDNAKSPWKTIHLPRALQGIGELGIGRPTSIIRSALRNDLLSISAFQLSNDHRFHERPDDAEKWYRAAAKYRCQAITSLNEAVTKDLNPHSRPKYKDFLATMISMVSINVMSGDTSTCGVHLDGAAQLISHMKSYKTEYSSKARALHRIYFYIRLIYESTAPLPLTPDHQLRRALHLKSMDTSENSRFIALHGRNRSSTDTLDLSSYECVYGIPQSLMDLMRRTIELVDMVSNSRSKSGMAVIPESLAHECDSLENELLGLDSEDFLSNTEPHDINARIIGHQTRAFHNALTIYFSQHIRNLHHRYLHAYIAAVIESVEEIEQIKADMDILAAPLYWPVFIAASEAFDKSLQERFRRWYDRVAMYGIEAVRTGVRVIFQVWKDGPAANRSTCAWRRVVDKTGVVLMLT